MYTMLVILVVGLVFAAAMIANSLRRSQGFKIELDAMPGGFVCSASLKGVCTTQEALDVAAGEIACHRCS